MLPLSSIWEVKCWNIDEWKHTLLSKEHDSHSAYLVQWYPAYPMIAFVFHFNHEPLCKFIYSVLCVISSKQNTAVSSAHKFKINSEIFRIIEERIAVHQIFFFTPNYDTHESLSLCNSSRYRDRATRIIIWKPRPPGGGQSSSLHWLCIAEGCLLVKGWQ